MLICPQCQFENSHRHKFCQRCNQSLTHKVCPQCDASVEVSKATCSDCGSFVGTVWSVVLQTKSSISPPIEETTASTEIYLDQSRRYKLLPNKIGKLLTQADAFDGSGELYEGKVLDGQPLEKSVLTTLFEQAKETENSLETKFTLWKKNGIPELAFPYLSLKEFLPTLPEIHETWQEGEREIVLLKDRSNWPSLCVTWYEEPPSTKAILYSLERIASIWENLLLNQCTQSLFLEQNLCLDPEDKFCIRQLYPDEQENKANLQDLGLFWQNLITQIKHPIAKPIEELLEKMVEGKFKNAQELSASLENIAETEEIIDSEEIYLPLDYLLPAKTETDAKTTKPDIEETEEDAPEPATEILPMQLQSLVEASCTDVGRARQHNEDSYGVKTHVRRQQSNRGKKIQARGLYIVCDGMGGHASGEVASAMAVETIQSYMRDGWKNKFPDRDTICSAILAANQAIYSTNQSNLSSGSGRMGTTLVMVIVQDTKIAVAHVGDSRVYRVSRKWGLEQLTIDHEVGQRQIQQGVDPELAYSRPDAYQLTQALGPHENNFLLPDVRFVDLQEDTLILLCTDGLSDNQFIEKHWEEYLSPLISSSSDIEVGLNRFIDLANEVNGHDNITGILVRIKVRPYLEQNFVF